MEKASTTTTTGTQTIKTRRALRNEGLCMLQYRGGLRERERPLYREYRLERERERERERLRRGPPM